MKSNNKYWGLPLCELKVHYDERIILLKFACFKHDWDEAQKHDLELSLIMDAIFAHERGLK